MSLPWQSVSPVSGVRIATSPVCGLVPRNDRASGFALLAMTELRRYRSSGFFPRPGVSPSPASMGVTGRLMQA